MPVDPTKTKTLRDKFEADAYKRFRRVKGAIRQAVADEDVLGLGEQEARNADYDTPNPNDFRFLTDAEKKERFMQWLRQRIDDDVLEPTTRDNIRRGRHWTGSYVRSASRKGVEHATRELKKQGYDVPKESIEDVFNAPIHTDKLALVYTRAYDALEGITQEMDTQISRVLSDALVQGWNPRKAASKINDRVDKIGITRARTMARTEIIHAHATSTLDRFEALGVEKVGVEVELRTAGDSRVCPTCASLNGNVYSINEARGLIPIHPGCRCAYLPLVE